MKKRILLCLMCFFYFVPTCSFADEAAPATVAKKQDLQHFDMINLSGVGNLHIKQTDQENFTMEADDALLPLIKVSVKEKTLYIDLADASDHLKAKINYYLNIKTVNSITATGLTNVYIPNGLQTNVLSLSMSGLGNEANINITAKQLIAKVEGGAKIQATGVANAQVIAINGAGEFDGTKLAGDLATVNINGSSIARTNISGKLLVTIEGDGEVRYCGKPVITQHITDNGKLSRQEGVLNIPRCSRHNLRAHCHQLTNRFWQSHTTHRNGMRSMFFSSSRIFSNIEMLFVSNGEILFKCFSK